METQHSDLNRNGTLRIGPNPRKPERLAWERDLGVQGVLVTIDKNALRIDPAYQRERGWPKVVRITREFSWAAFGMLIISERVPGEYYILDGGHRVAAAIRRPSITALPCYVFRGLSLAQEATIFVATNKHRKTITGLQVFKAQLLAQDPLALSVLTVAQKYGIGVGKGKHDLRSVQTACKLQNEGTLDGALAFVQHVWPDDIRRLGAKVLVGVANFGKILEDRCGTSLLADQTLSKFEGYSLPSLMQQAYTEADISRRARQTCFALAMLRRWNHGRRTKRVVLD